MTVSTVHSLLSLDNPVFRAYLFYVCVLAVKLLLMSLLTGATRFKKQVFANAEDVKLGGKAAKLKYDDPDVERVRRAHLNDLENIPIFILVALVYVVTEPSPTIAINLLRLFTLARVFHTFVYAIKPLPQPARAIFFFIGNAITFYMAVQGISTFMF